MVSPQTSYLASMLTTLDIERLPYSVRYTRELFLFTRVDGCTLFQRPPVAEVDVRPSAVGIIPWALD